MHKNTSRWGAVALAVTLTLGFHLLWVLALGCVWGMAEPLLSPSRYEQTIVLADGTVVIASRFRQNYRDVQYRNLDGTRHPGLNSTTSGISGMILAAETSGNVVSGWKARLGGFVVQRSVPEYWYSILDDAPPAALYFEGFEPRTKSRIGYFGRSGFSETIPPPSERFAHARVFNSLGWSSAEQEPLDMTYTGLPPSSTLAVYVSSGDVLLRIDLQQRSIKEILRQPGIVSAAQLLYAPPAQHAVPADGTAVVPQLVVRTADRLLYLHGDDQPPESYLLPEEVLDEHLYIYLLPDKTILAQVMGNLLGFRQSLIAFDAQGKILRRHELAGRISAAPAWLTSALTAMPVLDTVAQTIVIPFSQTALRPRWTFRDALKHTLSQTWPGLLANYFLGFVAAWLCIRHQRRNALPSTPLWASVTFLLGLPGLLGYWFHRTWPPRIECPHCRSRVPRDRPACSDCSRPFPRPAPTGAEIFA